MFKLGLRFLMGLETQELHALGFLPQLLSRLESLVFRAFCRKEEGHTFVVWRSEPYSFAALGRKAGPGGWKLWKATLGRDRVEVGCVEQFLCFSCPRLCACSFSCLAHLGRKKHRLFPLPMDPQPWEQRLAHSTTSAERL